MEYGITAQDIDFNDALSEFIRWDLNHYGILED